MSVFFDFITENGQWLALFVGAVVIRFALRSFVRWFMRRAGA